MGIFDWILRNMPGSPVNVAKTMLKVYKDYRAKYPDRSKEDALRYAIETRYRIIKTMNQEQIESCLAEAKTLGHLVFLVVAKENPSAAQYPLMKRTVKDLYSFFMKNAPDEIGNLEHLMKLVSIEV